MQENKRENREAKVSLPGGNTEGKGGLEIRSSEVQEILGGIPSRIVRFGMYLFLFVFVVLIAGSFVVEYPEVIQAKKIIVTTENPPADIIARATGKIEELLVDDKEKVHTGQAVALIQSSAEYPDIRKLNVLIDSVQLAFDSLGLVVRPVFEKNLQLGAIQESYAQFLKKYNDLLVFVEQNYYSQTDASLKQQRAMADILYSRLEQQKNSVNKEYEIRQRNFERQKDLKNQEVISPTDLERVEAEMLSKRGELEGLLTQLAERSIEMSELDQKIIDNEKMFSDQKNRIKSELEEAFDILKSEINNWEFTYLMRSPIEGTITFNKFWSVNQNMTLGDRAFTIVPENVGEPVGKVELPVRGSGKVKNGQIVNIKFDNYPFVEYGLVRGKVSNVSLVPGEDNFYMVKVVFPGGLVTNYGIPLELQNRLTGQAEIITEDLKLIQRIFNPLKALWKERIIN